MRSLIWFQGCSILVVFAAKRDVVITGTTVAPNWQRNHFERALTCPSSHPFSISRGNKCCSFYIKTNDTSVHSDCDGSPVNTYDSELCCQGQLIDCPGGKKCRNDPFTSEDGGWSSWSSWTSISRNMSSVWHPDPAAPPVGWCPVISSLKYCHLQEITEPSTGLSMGKFTYWQDRTALVGNAYFSKIYYFGGTDNRYSEVTLQCSNDLSLSYVGGSGLKYLFNLYTIAACNMPCKTEVFERKRQCDNPKPHGPLGRCEGDAVQREEKCVTQMIRVSRYIDTTGIAFQAVDGNIDTILHGSGCCGYPWTVFEYPEEKIVDSVGFYHRWWQFGRFHDVVIRVGNTQVQPSHSAEINFNDYCFGFSGVYDPFSNPLTLSCVSPKPKGRFVSVQINSTDASILELLEFYITFV